MATRDEDAGRGAGSMTGLTARSWDGVGTARHWKCGGAGMPARMIWIDGVELVARTSSGQVSSGDRPEIDAESSGREILAGGWAR